MTDQEHALAKDILSAALTLMSILLAVITFLFLEYKVSRTYPELAEPLHNATFGAFAVSLFSAVIALWALFLLLLQKGSVRLLSVAFAILIFSIGIGIIYVGATLLA